jgi:hypothetical protein
MHLFFRTVLERFPFIRLPITLGPSGLFYVSEVVTKKLLEVAGYSGQKIVFSGATMFVVIPSFFDS